MAAHVTALLWLVLQKCAVMGVLPLVLLALLPALLRQKQAPMQGRRERERPTHCCYRHGRGERELVVKVDCYQEVGREVV